MTKTGKISIAVDSGELTDAIYKVLAEQYGANELVSFTTQSVININQKTLDWDCADERQTRNRPDGWYRDTFKNCKPKY